MYCQFEACRECCQTYILGESTVKCMNGACGREWTRKFIHESFTAAFINKELKAHRENIIYEREQALLPATQPYAEYEMKLKPLEERRKELLSVRRPIERELYTLKNNRFLGRINSPELPTADIDKKIADKKREIKKLTEAIDRINYDRFVLGRELRRQTQLDADVVEGGAAPVERKQFIKPCPADECRGFLSTQWKCGLCELWTCPDCHVVIGDSKEAAHTCDPNNVETAKMLKAETKPCPKCHSAIFKIDGCDQMWCTQCHTAFSWKSGNIETKIHNPHYYEWLRKTQGSVPRDPLDNPCARGQFDNRIMNDIYLALVTNVTASEHIDTLMSRVRGIVRNVLHLTQSEIPRLRPRNYEERNRELRVKYLLKEITSAQLKKTIQQLEKKNAKEAELRDVYQTMATTAEDIMFRFRAYIVSLPPRTPVRTTILMELNEITAYTNECLADISLTYGCVKHQFANRVKLVTMNAEEKAKQAAKATITTAPMAPVPALVPVTA